MNTRTLGLWSLAALGAVLLTNDPVYRAVILLICLNVALEVAPAGLRGLTPALALTGLGAMLMNILLAHSGDTVYARLPAALPGIGGPLTVESAAYGADVVLGLWAAILSVAPLSATDPSLLVDALPRSLERAGSAVAAALQFVPAVVHNFGAVADAQRMRGWRPRGPRSWAEVLVPVMVDALEDSIHLAEMLEARGYGSGPRTRYPAAAAQRRIGPQAWLGLAGLAVFFALRLAGGMPQWYPLPHLTAPPLSAPGLAACLLLSLPAIRWRWLNSTT